MMAGYFFRYRNYISVIREIRLKSLKQFFLQFFTIQIHMNLKVHIKLINDPVRPQNGRCTSDSHYSKNIKNKKYICNNLLNFHVSFCDHWPVNVRLPCNEFK